MKRNASAGLGRLGIFALTSTAILTFSFYLGSPVKADDAAGGGNKKIAELIALNHKFIGSASCKSCHGDAATPGEAKKGTEMTVWSTVDKHHEAFTNLQSDRSKAIATKGGYGDATTSARCLSCHSIALPASAAAPTFQAQEGVSCEACHGPAADWSGSNGAPHNAKGWAAKRRDANPDAPSLKNAAKADGFWDVRDPSLRAENCASCHLAIDPKMVAAGHPEPAFELNEYALEEPKHWTDKRSDQYYTQLWAAGQVACARDAMTELASRAGGGAAPELIKSSYNQAMAHGTMLKILVNADGGPGNGVAGVKDAVNKGVDDLLATKGTDAAKIKDAATALSGAADKAFADLPNFAPDAGATTALLAGVTAAAPDMIKNYDRRGAEQAAYAARWLYLSKAWDSDAKKELPADVAAQYKTFFDDRFKPLGDDGAKYLDVIGKLK